MQISANLTPYWLLLRDLSASEKLSLIELLAQSLKNSPSAAPKLSKNKPQALPPDDWVRRFEGSWSDFPDSAEDMIALIENTRSGGRHVEPL